MGIVSGIVATTGGTNTSDATAKAYDIKTGKTAYISTGSTTGTGYFPAMMEYNGTDGYYSDTFTSSGNAVTIVARFACASFTGGASKMILRAVTTTPRGIGQISLISNDHATAGRRSRILCNVVNSAGSNICQLVSTNTFDDGEPHTVFFAYNATAGTAILRVDGVDEMNTGNAEHVLTTGTMDRGASSVFNVGRHQTSGLYWSEQIGFVGYRQAYLTNWSDFMQTDGTPKNIESTLNTVWGAQPLYWNESGYLQDNKGSEGAMTANGTIILAAASTWS